MMQVDIGYRRRFRWLRGLALVVPLLAIAWAVSTPAAANGKATSSETQEFPFRLTDCRGLWFKMYAPRDALQRAVPERYEVYGSHTGGSPLDEPAGLVFGNLYVQTDRCLDHKGREVTFSRVAAQVRQPAFDPDVVPVQHDVDKPSGNWWEYYYLLAVVLPENDKATAGLHRYLAAHGLPVSTGKIDAVLEKMGAAPTGRVTPRIDVRAGDLDYGVAGSSWSGLFEPLHEHVTSYYHDSAGPDGEPRTSRMVIDSLTFDWLAECTTTTSSLRMARLMGGGRSLGGWCFFMEGPDTWIGASALP